MFFSFCLAWYTVLASRVKSNILIIIVTIKLLHREIWRFICSLYIHEKIKYSCNPSVYQATHTGDLKTHIQSVHEKIKYSCNQCDHQATTQASLKTHIQSIHEKIKYSCDQCDHQSTVKGDLKKHIQSVHAKIKYSCNQCDYQATYNTWKSEDSYSVFTWKNQIFLLSMWLL